MEYEIVAVIVVAICTLLLFAISALSIKGQSYEEAVAANRKLIVAQRGLLEDPVKQKRLQQQQTKKNKKAGKKVKEKQAKEQAAATSSSEIESVHAESGLEDDSSSSRGHVEFAETTIVVTPEEIKPPKEKIEAKKEKEAKKSKSDKNVTKVAVKQEKEKVAKTETPINLEPPKEQRKGKNKTSTVATEDKSHEEALPTIAVSQPNDLTTDKILKHTYPLEVQNVAVNNVSENIQTKQVVSQTSAVVQKQPKKKKNELAQYQQLLSCPEGVNVNILVQLLGDAPLSRSEIQILTDCLLNKQNGPLPEHSEWSEGPKDPLQKMKKQLAEKEKALTDEQEATQAAQAKLKELKNTLNAERARCSQISHGAEEAKNALKAESAALQTRIQRGIDENKAMRQQILQLQAKVSAEAEWNSQRTQLEKHIQSLSEKNVSLNSILTPLQEEIVLIRKAHNDKSNELLAARDLINSLEEYRQRYEQSEIQREGLKQKEQMLLQELRLAEESAKLLVDAKSEINKLMSTHSQSQKDIINHEKRVEEMDKQSQLMEAELTKLKSEKDELNKMVSDLNEKLATQPTSNGTTSPDKEDTVSTEKAVAAACRELEEHHSQQIKNLQNQLDQYRDKNNELRTKNWKVMEALQAAEMKLQYDAQKAPDDSSIREAVVKACLDEQNKNKEILKRLFPEITVDQSDYQEWTNSFVQLANKQLNDNIANAEALTEESKKTKDMQAHNEKLQLMVDNYQKIIDDMDKTLMKIQAGATEQDNKWKKEFSEKQKELDDLKQITINNMKKEIESLQSTLDKEKKCENEFKLEEFNPIQTSKTFASAGMADVERLLEENTRLRETVERLQISSQSLNGPSQDGSEEK